MPAQTITVPPRAGLIARLVTLTPPWWGRADVIFGAGLALAVLLSPWPGGETHDHAVHLSLQRWPDGVWRMKHQYAPGSPPEATWRETFEVERSLLWWSYRVVGVGRPELDDPSVTPRVVPDRESVLRAWEWERGSMLVLKNAGADQAVPEGLLAGRTRIESSAWLAAVGRASAPVAIILVVVGCVLAMQRWPRRWRYRRILRSVDSGICPGPRCRYSVAGLGGVCPECGLNYAALETEAAAALGWPR